MLRKLLIPDLIQRVGSEIRVVESGITRHENGTDNSLRDPAGIRLYHFCGIRDHNLSRFWNQGSEIGYKNGNQRGKKNILRYHHVIQAWWSPDMDRTTFSEKKTAPEIFSCTCRARGDSASVEKFIRRREIHVSSVKTEHENLVFLNPAIDYWIHFS